MSQTIISFQITEEERGLLRKVFYLEPWLQDSIDNRRRKGNKYQFKLADDEYDDCLSALEFHSDGEPLEGYKFVALARKIEAHWKLCKALPITRV